MNDETFFGEMACGHCLNEVRMRVVAQHSQVQRHDDPGSPFPHEFEAGPVYYLLRCPACDQVTLCEVFYHEFEEPGGTSAKVLYPAAERRVSGLPPPVDRAYRAAWAVRRVDANAYAVMLGRLLEAVCADRGARGSTLADRVRDLAHRGEVSGRLADVARSFKALRNIGAHFDAGTLSDTEVPVLDALCDAILGDCSKTIPTPGILSRDLKSGAQLKDDRGLWYGMKRHQS